MLCVCVRFACLLLVGFVAVGWVCICVCGYMLVVFCYTRTQLFPAPLSSTEIVFASHRMSDVVRAMRTRF